MPQTCHLLQRTKIFLKVEHAGIRVLWNISFPKIPMFQHDGTPENSNCTCSFALERRNFQIADVPVRWNIGFPKFPMFQRGGTSEFASTRSRCVPATQLRRTSHLAARWCAFSSVIPRLEGQDYGKKLRRMTGTTLARRTLGCLHVERIGTR